MALEVDATDFGQWLGRVQPLQEGVRTKATELGLDPALAQSLVHQESGWNPQAVSPTGVTGLAQVTIPTGLPYGQTPATRTDPNVSTHAGLSYFKDLLVQHNGNVRQALTAYNGGSDPRYADNVLQHYPLYAGPGASKPAAGGGAGIDVEDFGRWLKTQGQAPPAGPGQPGVPVQGQTSAPSTGGTQMTINIEKPSTGNLPGDLQRVPESDWDALLGRTPGGLGERLRDAGAMGINIIGSAGGALLGGMGGTALVGPAGTVPGAVAGEMAGGFGAHKLNQAIGLESGDPTTFDPTLWPPSGDVLSLGGPLAVRGIGALGKQVVKRLPGAAAALHEDAVQALKELPERFAPAQPSSVFYGQLAAGTNPRINATNLAAEAQAILNEQLAKKPSFQNTTLIKHAQDLVDLAHGHQGQIPIEELHIYHKDIGLLQKQARRASAPEEAAYKRLYGATYDDLDAAALQGTPEATMLRQANQARRREYAQADLTEMFTPGAPGLTTRADGLTQVQGGKLTDRFNKKLTDDPIFAKSFTSQERTDILDLLHSMQKIPRIPQVKGVAIGSGLAALRTGMTYTAAKILFKDELVAQGLGGLALMAPHIISSATMSAPGRFLIRQYINAGQIIGPTELAALRSVVEQNRGTPVPGAPR